MDKTSPSRNPELRWIKASKSIGSNACVELASADGMILLRDSKRPEDPPLRYTWTEIDAFIDGARKGEFDALLDAVKAGWPPVSTRSSSTKPTIVPLSGSGQRQL